MSEILYKIVNGIKSQLTEREKTEREAANRPVEKSAAELLDEWRATATASPANIRLILHRTGALAAIQAAIANNPEAMIVFEYATEIRRNAAMILQLSTGAGFSPVQVDALFRAAIALETTP